MELTGESLIGSRRSRGTDNGTGTTFRAFHPSRQTEGDIDFFNAGSAEVDEACALAQAAAAPFAATPREVRAAFLEAVASALADDADRIVPTCMAESGLPEARLRGELARTTNQLRLFAGVLRDGAYLDVRVDSALPDRVPPRPDLRVIKQPLGPVAVFGASNFPLAFSVAGGDTASAFAAGCPVVVKAHSAHPATSERVGRIIQRTVAELGLPEGTFSLLFGSGAVVGQGLVADPRITAVGFTGSRSGGLALCETAARRSVPIPVFAEMSSINPVVLLPAALQARGAAIGTAFAAAQTMGAGQFCTNPGLLLAVDGPELDDFVAAVGSAYAASAPATMLTPGIHAAFCSAVERLEGNPRVSMLAQGPAAAGLQCCPQLLATTAADFLADPSLSDEVFGAASLVVRCADAAQLLQVLAALEGQLTAAIHADSGDGDLVEQLVPLLAQKAGRVLFNGFGTGVEVADAMVHGGPYPATSAPQTTSVGSLAIDRFLRPICYQDTPPVFLPEDLRDENLPGLPHRRDGRRVAP